MINDLLFVYGSLLDSSNDFACYLTNNAVLCCMGKFKGKLYDLGEYPGAIADPDTNQYVYGSIYKLNYPDKAFEILDDYEGFGAGQSQPNLFIRELRSIENENNIETCWVYLYNLPVPDFNEITSGNYPDYLKQKKR